MLDNFSNSSLEGGLRYCRETIHDSPGFAIVIDGLLDRLVDAHRSHGENLEGGYVPNDGRILQALDQMTPDLEAGGSH